MKDLSDILRQMHGEALGLAAVGGPRTAEYGVRIRALVEQAWDSHADGHAAARVLGQVLHEADRLWQIRNPVTRPYAKTIERLASEALEVAADIAAQPVVISMREKHGT